MRRVPLPPLATKIELHRGDRPGMSRRRKILFLATAHVTADAVDYFRLPRETLLLASSSHSGRTSTRVGPATPLACEDGD
jgi:hypothetical protein